MQLESMKWCGRKADPWGTPIKPIASFVQSRPIGAESDLFKAINSVNGSTVKRRQTKSPRHIQISLYPPAIFHISITIAGLYIALLHRIKFLKQAKLLTRIYNTTLCWSGTVIYDNLDIDRKNGYYSTGFQINIENKKILVLLLWWQWNL